MQGSHKMIKLENTHKSYFDCLEDCFTSVIHYYKKDYMYIFAEAWRVNTYTNNMKNVITDLLLFCNTCDVVDRYCGLKSDIRNFYKYEYLEEYLIQCVKEEKPIIVSVDLYDLPWSEYYNRVHSPHFAIIYDYVGNHKFVLSDVTRQIDYIELDLEKAFDGRTCTILISEPEEEREIQIEDAIKLSKQILQKDVEEDYGYDVLYYIADYYFKQNNNLFELAKEDVESELFINRLIYFGRQRLSFSEFLRHAAAKTGDTSYQTIMKELGELGAKWLTFRNKLMKIRLKGTFDEKKEELRALWIQLIEKDKGLYEKYVNFNKKEQGIQKNEIDFETLAPHTIDISNQFNSNAFNSHQWKNNSGFDLNGYYYELNQESMYYQDAHCNLKFYTNQQLDNMSCNQQTIPIMRSDIKAVMVIGSCENGDYSEELSCIYDKGEESVTLIFTDWWERDRFNEKVVKKLKCARLTEKGVHNAGEVYIFSQVLMLQNGENNLLKSITFPDCSNIHIFGLIVYS